jgi:hypothetical protein
MNREGLNRTNEEQAAHFSNEGALESIATKAVTKKDAYSYAKELLEARVKNLTGGMPLAVNIDHRGRKIYPKNHHEIVSAENALLAVQTGAADSVVREILAGELVKATELLQKLDTEHQDDPDWKSSPAVKVLSNEVEALVAAQKALNTQAN